MKNKVKEYKSFNLPNGFTALEQYFHYLKEFNVIPKQISAQTIEEIFISVSKDYLGGFLSFDTYTGIIDNLYSNFVLGQIGVNKTIEHFMDDLEDEEKLNEKEFKDNLQEFIRQRG